MDAILRYFMHTIYFTRHSAKRERDENQTELIVNFRTPQMPFLITKFDQSTEQTKQIKFVE